MRRKICNPIFSTKKSDYKFLNFKKYVYLNFSSALLMRFSMIYLHDFLALTMSEFPQATAFSSTTEAVEYLLQINAIRNEKICTCGSNSLLKNKENEGEIFFYAFSTEVHAML